MSNKPEPASPRKMTAGEMIDTGALDGDYAARVTGGREWYVRAYRLKLQGAIELISERIGKRSDGSVFGRQVRRCVKEETIMEVEAMTALQFSFVDTTSRDSIRLRKRAALRVMSTTSKTVLQVVELMIARGLTIQSPYGFYQISAVDVVDFLENEDAWFAKRHGITIEQLGWWREWQNGVCCTALTAKGKPCCYGIRNPTFEQFCARPSRPPALCELHAGLAQYE